MKLVTGIGALVLATIPAAVGAADVSPTPGSEAEARCVALPSRLPATIADAKVVFVADNAGSPAYCRINGSIEKRMGADGRPYAIAFELRLPANWNGSLLYQGGGGLNGILFPATGAGPTILGTKSPSPLQKGFAVVSSDSGHTGGSSAFGRDQLATINFSYAAIGKVARTAKQLIELVASRVPSRSYFMGCSNGGREAMIAAQRFPDEFDGVVAANPAFNIIEAGLLANYSTQTYLKLSQPTRKLPLTQADFKLIATAVTRQCDGLDGREDGMIFAQEACHFDPVVVQCRSGKTNDCLDKGKVDAIRQAFRGPVDRFGKPLFSPWPYNSGIGDIGWLSWQTGPVDKEGHLGSRQNGLVADAMAGLFSYPPIDQAQLASLDPETALRDMAPMAAQLQATDTRMSTFSARGGKMLMITGWNDPIFSANDLTRWYRKLDANEKTLGRSGAGDFARLFMVPGMLHCGGGNALDGVDPLTALTDWVEKGLAPERINAVGKAFPGQSRPLCAYPAYARYDGKSDPADASSYVCTSGTVKN